MVAKRIGGPSNPYDAQYVCWCCVADLCIWFVKHRCRHIMRFEKNEIKKKETGKKCNAAIADFRNPSPRNNAASCAQFTIKMKLLLMIMMSQVEISENWTSRAWGELESLRHFSSWTILMLSKEGKVEDVNCCNRLYHRHIIYCPGAQFGIWPIKFTAYWNYNDVHRIWCMKFQIHPETSWSRRWLTSINSRTNGNCTNFKKTVVRPRRATREGVVLF